MEPSPAAAAALDANVFVMNSGFVRIPYLAPVIIFVVKSSQAGLPNDTPHLCYLDKHC